MYVTCKVPSLRGSKPGIVSLHNIDFMKAKKEGRKGLVWKEHGYI